jgi:phage FluMu gp28-like protein
METEDRVRIFGTTTLKNELAANDIQSFQQEYECVFIDSAESYIPLDLIYANTPGMRERDRATELAEGEGEPFDKGDIEVHVAKTADELLSAYSALGIEAAGKYGKLYMGYDVARRRDAAVIFVIGYLPSGKKLSVAEIEMRNEKFEFQLAQFRKIMKSLPVVRACIDQTGQGEPLYERLHDEFKSKVEGVIFNLESKGILALDVKTGLENHEFLLQNDGRFHRQIHSIKRIPVSGHNFKYESERDDNGHADSFWAWALANHAVIASARPLNYWEERARKKNENTLRLEEKKPSTEAASQNLTTGRGKSLNSVLRGIENNVYKKRN